MAQARIVVAVGDPAAAERIRDNLAALEFDVLANVTTGEEAVNKAEEIQPDLVLIGVRLKGQMDGIQAARQIRAHLDIPVVFLVTHTDQETLQQAKREEHFYHVSEPFQAPSLCSAIEVALTQHSMDKKLRESEERYRHVLETDLNAIVIYRDGKIILANPAAAKLIGATGPEEMEGMPVLDSVHPDYVEIARERIRQVSEGVHLPIVEIRIIRQDGSAIDAEIQTSPILYQGQPAAQAFIRDITERKRAEAVLRSSLRLFQSMDPLSEDEILQRGLEEGVRLTGSEIGYFHLVDPDQRTIQLQAWSQGTMERCIVREKARHYPIDQAGVWVDCIHQKRPVIHNDYAGLPHKKGLPAGHVPIVREMAVPVFEQGRIVAVLGVGNKPQDYTEFDVDQLALLAENMWTMLQRKRAEKLLAREAESNAVVADLSRALISPATLEGISLLVLDQAQRLTGSAFGFVGYIDPQTGYMICPTLTMDIWDNCQVEGKDVVFRNFTGLWGWVLRHQQPLLTNNPAQDPRSSGTPVGHLPIHRFLSAPALIGDEVVGQVAVANADRDYTERDQSLIEQLAWLYALAITRKQAEELLRQRSAELQAQNEELDAFAHTVAHDLKGPLSVLVGYAEFLGKYYSDMAVEDMQEFLHQIEQGGRKMSSIIRELLLLASVRKERVTLGSVNMGRILAEVHQGLRFLIEEHQAEIVTPDSWPSAIGYSPWIEEVWINYITNALKYGGHPPRVELGATEQADGMIRFWVKDNGRGLTPEEQAGLFVPFSKLLGIRAEGQGLGLSIVRRIIDRLGGQVGVEGKPGQGSTFFFTLPGLHMDSTQPPA